AEIDARFVAVRADGDARPDLAERYADYAWPATIVLDPNGRELLALRGYRSPQAFLTLLRQVHVGGSPIVAQEAEPAGERDGVRADLIARLDALYDPQAQGWGGPQRYPFAAPVELALYRAEVR